MPPIFKDLDPNNIDSNNIITRELALMINKIKALETEYKIKKVVNVKMIISCGPHKHVNQYHF